MGISMNVLNCRRKFFIGVSREERGTLRRVTFVLRVGNNKVTPLVKKKVLRSPVSQVILARNGNSGSVAPT